MRNSVISRSKLLLARSTGFTLVELVGVIVVIGILAIVALPRAFDRQTYDTRTFYDTTLSMLRFAQKSAMAQQREVTVRITGNLICMTYAPATDCDDVPNSVLNPANRQRFRMTVPAGITLTTATFVFTASGSTPARVVLTVTGDMTRTITVERETGYVH